MAASQDPRLEIIPSSTLRNILPTAPLAEEEEQQYMELKGVEVKRITTSIVSEVYQRGCLGSMLVERGARWNLVFQFSHEPWDIMHLVYWSESTEHQCCCGKVVPY